MKLHKNGIQLTITHWDDEFVFSPRTSKLLYFSTSGTEGSISSAKTIMIEGKPYEITSRDRDDPSAIRLNLAVSKPEDVGQIPPPSHYPAYTMLTPEQRWIYINWLTNTRSPIDVGYVFIYYYGLERQLLFGDYDAAFEEIVELRTTHGNRSSLPSYMYSALVISSIYRQRLDRLKDLLQAVNLFDLGFIAPFIVFLADSDLTSEQIIEISRRIKGVNRRYITQERELFLEILQKNVQVRYKGDNFPFARQYSLDEIPKMTIAFANITFPERLRFYLAPDFLQFAPFIDEVASILASTHQEVKLIVTNNRKRSNI